MAKITKTAVDNLKAPEKGDAWLWDSEVEGFGVRVQASGRKVYVIRYRTKDAKQTQRKLTLARCCDMPPDKARELARKRFAEIAEGMDPVALRKPEPAIEAAKTASLGQMFEGYITSLRAKGRISVVEVERALLKAANNAADALGRDRPAADITPGEVVSYLATFYQRGHRGAADKHRSYIASAFTWAIRSANDYTTAERQDWGVTSNPASVVAKDPGAITARDRNLTPLEMRKFWQATEPGKGGFSLEMAVLLRTLMLCGQRVQETLRMEGSEIDLKAGVWRMPAAKTKGRKLPHIIPLPRQVIPLLAELIVEHGDGYLFVSEREGVKAQMECRSVNHAVGRWLKRNDVNMEHFQPRDLRRTWKSRTHDAGLDRHVRDLIQQHAKNDTGSKHYDRAEYFPQMHAGMIKWANWFDLVMGGGPVAAVPLAIAA